MTEDGGELHVARPMAEHQADPDFTGWIWAMVEAPVERHFGPAEKINITVPARVLTRIEEFARQRRVTLRVPGARGSGSHARLIAS